jgi:diguanylate cyclase (GGDEF)-like protein
MADEIRQALEAEQIHFDNKVLRITGSIGVAGTDRTRIFSQSGQLTNAADRAVYAAKAAGRNCVRLFRPKVQAPAAGTTAAAGAAPAQPAAAPR